MHPKRRTVVMSLGALAGLRLASAIEFILEGLHLSNRLNKTSAEHGAVYGVK